MSEFINFKTETLRTLPDTFEDKPVLGRHMPEPGKDFALYHHKNNVDLVKLLHVEKLTGVATKLDDSDRVIYEVEFTGRVIDTKRQCTGKLTFTRAEDDALQFLKLKYSEYNNRSYICNKLATKILCHEPLPGGQDTKQAKPGEYIILPKSSPKGGFMPVQPNCALI